MMPLKTFADDVGNLLGAENLCRIESASLRLDKLTFLGDNSKKEQIDKVCAIANAKRTSSPMPIIGDRTFSLKLGGRLMVNMAGGVLENSGLCLHPFFNYPMIPGSSLKGIAGHAAWLEWKELMDGKKEDMAKELSLKIISVFGFPTGAKDLDDFIEKAHGISRKKVQKAGKISFLQAVPADNTWRLVPDVLTPHGGNDYKNPVPSFFIATEKGATFKFSLLKTARGSDEDLNLAAAWLKKGLIDSGAGAKTVAGYGFFLPDVTQVQDCITLKLATPGFFGGADHKNKEDTLLRVPSLRGMLRWWWRTLYRGILPDENVKILENQIWGSTSTGKSLVSIRIISSEQQKQEFFSYKDGFAPKPAFRASHALMPPPRGSTQGLFYLSYGMDEVIRQEPRRRFYLDSGATWRISLSARKGKANFSEEDIMNQALAALSLLCRFGGIGSKARKGFGSLVWENAWSLEECREVARNFCVKNENRIVEQAAPYSWKTAIMDEIRIPWNDPWTAIDRLGFAVQSFAQKYKHQDCKAVLGLPRKIHGPKNEPMPHQRGCHKCPENLRPLLRDACNGDKTRFASPIWYHVEPSANGSLIRITAFPSDMIRDVDTSRSMYEELMEHIKNKLKEYAEAPPQNPTRHQFQEHRNYRPERQRFQPATSSGYKAGDKTRAVLLEEKTKKGGWKAKVEGTDISGPIQNTEKVPPERKAGETVELVIKIAKGRDSAFAWPT